MDMTILLTGCPFCSSNFMLLNTELSKGECVVCGKDQKFTPEQISEAETNRDRLSEKYLSRLEKAYNDRDQEKMASLAEEVANAGISSWYAWFCVGWSDLQEGKIGSAFDDFKLAALFIEEEDFDEFYELAMDAVLDSIEKAAKEDKNWSTEDTTLVDFTGTLFERFEHLCEMDFMCDLMLRLGTLSDSLESAGMGASLIKEIMMIIMDYMSGNTYVVDHQTLLNNAKSSIDSIDAQMQTMAQDGSMAPNIVKIWGPGFSEFVQMLLDGEDAMAATYSDEELLTLCDYWGVNDYEDVFGLLQNAFEFHLGYIMSGKRNKGILKKRDKALKDYQEAFKRPLVEGIASDVETGDLDYDRICPDCGKYLKADENGLMTCECGFKSRIVTDDIDSLPENVPELILIGRKAFQDRDPRMLNNVGERILEFEEGNWYGFFALAESCLLDQQLCEAIMLLAQACEHLPEKDRKEFRDGAVEELGRALTEINDPDQNMVSIFATTFYEALDNSPAKECGIPMALIRRMAKGDYDTSLKGLTATLMIDPTLNHEIHSNTSLRYLKSVSEEILVLLDRVDEGMNGIKKDESGMKDDVTTYSKTMHDLLSYMIAGIDGHIGSSSEEKVGYMAGQWAADKESYDGLADGLFEAFCFDPDAAYKPNSNAIMKSKHGIDRYLDAYMKTKSI